MTKEEIEIIEQLYKSALKKTKCSEFTDSEYKQAKRINDKYFPDRKFIKKCNGSDGGTVKGLILSLKIFSENYKIIDMNNNLFELKNVTIRVHGFGVFGKQSIDIDQDLAKRLLKKYPVFIKHFAKYPTNWQEIVNSNTPIVVMPQLKSAEIESRKERYEKLKKYNKYSHIPIDEMSNEVFEDFMIMLQIESNREIKEEEKEVINEVPKKTYNKKGTKKDNKKS
jgi:hypothetical protein